MGVNGEVPEELLEMIRRSYATCADVINKLAGMHYAIDEALQVHAIVVERMIALRTEFMALLDKGPQTPPDGFV